MPAGLHALHNDDIHIRVGCRGRFYGGADRMENETSCRMNRRHMVAGIAPKRPKNTNPHAQRQRNALGLGPGKNNVYREWSIGETPCAGE
jgi:hypothetical protein